MKKKEKNNNKKDVVINKKVLLPLVIIAMLSFICYIIITIIYNKNIFTSLNTLIGIIIGLLFIICFSIISLKSNSRKSIPFIFIGFLLVIAFCIVNILTELGIIGSLKSNYVMNFYNTPITEVYNWNKDKHLTISEIYEYSDIIPAYYVISQDVSAQTLISDISKITLIISKGPDYNKEVVVPSFVGRKYEDVIKYLEDNYLNNVEFIFSESTNPVDTVIFQEGSGSRKRSDLIKLTLAKGEIEPTNIIDFTNKSLLYSTSWLERYGFKYEIQYANSDDIKKNYVISQNVTNEVKDPKTDTIMLTVSKGKIIKVPDFNTMSLESINKWIMDNNLKVSYEEKYDEEVKLGDIINSSVKENDVIESESKIEITVSKGKLEMPKLDDITVFSLWAQENDVDYELVYEYSNNVLKDSIIKCSHQTGDLIKDNDTVIITISKGKSVSIPSFVTMSKSAIQTKCKELNINCSFTYGGYTENIKKDIATKQSKPKGTVVSEGTNLVITLSSGTYEKVNVPSMVGKTKSTINNTCKSLGVTCKFVYQSSFSSKAKDTCVSQSKTGSVNKGSTITFTLSKGPAQTYNVVIDANQLSNGNPEATKATLQKKLSTACPGVTFVFKFQKANSGIGYLAPTSQVKVGTNSFVQGKTYTVIINSN